MRSSDEQEQIIDWLRRGILSGSTEYRSYHADALKNRLQR